MKRRLRVPQALAQPYVNRTQHPGLLMQMRLGKCLVFIRRCLRYLPLNTRDIRALIVAPSSAFKGWLDELAEEGQEDISLLIGSRKERLALLAKDRRWNIINKEGHLALPEIAEKPWDAVVLDESTFIKNPKAKVTKFFLKNFKGVPHRWILTGTINPEDDRDVFCQLAFLNGKAFGTRNYWDFQSRFYKPSVTGYGWVPRRGTQTRIRTELAKSTFILRREDVDMDVPKIYQRREIAIPPEHEATYAKIEKEFALHKESGEVIEAKYAVSKYQWLRQFCGGFVDKELVWDGKMKELEYLLRGELRQEPLVIWFHYNHEIEAVSKLLLKLGITHTTLHGKGELKDHKKRLEHIGWFKDGHVQVILIQQAVGQMGMDLSRADTCIYYSTPEGSLARQQTEDRILNVDRKTSLLILDLIVKDTVDEDILDHVQDKADRSQWTLSRARKLSRKRHAS